MIERPLYVANESDPSVECVREWVSEWVSEWVGEWVGVTTIP